MTRRDYPALAKSFQDSPRPESRDGRMHAVVDRVWLALHPTGVSWVGFYLDHPQEPDDRRLVLGPHRDRPACSPIGLHGVCGQALTSRQVRIVRDVRTLGARYIACDPRDRSEIAIPLMDDSRRCWGVLDLDSWNVGEFDESDALGLNRVLLTSGLLSSF